MDGLLHIPKPDRVIVSGTDAPGMRPELLVAEGEAVCAGQVLARDRRRPWTALTSPCSGRVGEIRRGPRRSIDRVVLDFVGEFGEDAPPKTELGSAPDRDTLVRDGLWSAICARPFAGIADPEREPGAIMVTGFFSDPEAPDPAGLMTEADRAALSGGLALLAGLADCGAVLVLAGADPTQGAAIPGLVRQKAPKASARGLGALVRHVGPASAERPIWHLDWQETMILGRRVAGENGPPYRFLTLRSATAPLRVIRAVVGTPLGDIARAVGAPPAHLVAGAPGLLRGAPAIGRRDDRLTLLSGFPAPRRTSVAGPVLPLPALEAALPQIGAPVLFLRALAAGDDETALRLGALDLGPEDLALCSHLCLSGNDYPALLTGLLERQAEEWQSA